VIGRGRVLAAVVAAGAACVAVFAGSGLGSVGSATRVGAAGKTTCPVRVLEITNSTGAGATNGLAQRPGLALAVAQVNKAGGVLGCPLVADVKDEGSDPTKDLPLLQEALSSHQYGNVIVSDFGEGAAIPYLTRQKVLNITNFSAGAGNPKVNPYFFDDYPLLSVATEYAAKAAMKAGHKKIAVIVFNNDIGAAAAAGVKSAAPAGGAKVVDVEQLDPTAVNTTPAITRARNSGADVVVMDMAGAVVGHLLTDLQASGWKVPIYGGASTFSFPIASVAPPAAYKNLLVVGPTVATWPSSPKVNTFISKLKAQPGGSNGLKTVLVSATSPYDDVILFAWAANKVGSLDPKKISAFLETHGSTPVPGLLVSDVTGYTSKSHDFFPPGSLALARPGPLKDGRLKRIAIVN
jgi:branched-chain amino acid transport system substrate-binding protein